MQTRRKLINEKIRIMLFGNARVIGILFQSGADEVSTARFGFRTVRLGGRCDMKQGGAAERFTASHKTSKKLASKKSAVASTSRRSPAGLWVSGVSKCNQVVGNGCAAAP
jgi:hypothetical protein